MSTHFTLYISCSSFEVVATPSAKFQTPSLNVNLAFFSICSYTLPSKVFFGNVLFKIKRKEKWKLAISNLFACTLPSRGEANYVRNQKNCCETQAGKAH